MLEIGGVHRDGQAKVCEAEAAEDEKEQAEPRVLDGQYLPIGEPVENHTQEQGQIADNQAAEKRPQAISPGDLRGADGEHAQLFELPAKAHHDDRAHRIFKSIAQVTHHHQAGYQKCQVGKVVDIFDLFSDTHAKDQEVKPGADQGRCDRLVEDLERAAHFPVEERQKRGDSTHR